GLARAGLKDVANPDAPGIAKPSPRQRVEVRKQGKFRIARDLRARGVPGRHINEALSDSADTEKETANVRQRIERKLRSFRGEISEKKFASIYRSLLAAGFSADLIRRELKSFTREDLPEADPQK